MQYHLDTIPVWEAMESKSQCPLCALYHKTERMEIERSLGGSVMEPDTRIRVNERGICEKHHQQLFFMQNRLGHALLTDSHTKEWLKKLDKLTPPVSGGGGGMRSFFGASQDSPTAKLVSELKKLAETCVICENAQQHMNRYFYTFLHLWKTDTKFQDVWNGSTGVCLPHAAELLEHAEQQLSAAQQKELAASVLSHLRASLAQDEKDLEWFTLKFDYRNQDKPWGNSKNALERTINRLRGWCVGEEIEGKKS